MATHNDAATLAITGHFSAVLLAAAPLALVVSLVVLQVFRSAVKHSMMSRGAAGSVGDAVDAAPAPPPVALGVEDVGDDARRDPLLGLPSALAYALGGFTYALAMAWAFFYAKGLELLPSRTAYLALAYAWPAIIAIGLAAATSWRGWLVLFTGYFGLILVAVAPTLGAVSLGEVAYMWVVMNGPPTALVLFFLARPIRSVGPLALVFMIALVSSATISLGFIGAEEARIEWLAGVAGALGLGAVGIVLLLIAVFALGTGTVGWIVIILIGRLYRARAITDQTMIIDSMFLVFALVHAMDLVFVAPVWYLAGLVAFAAYKIVSAVAFALFRSRQESRAARLLLLRVFSLGKRSERLFDAFGKLWRRKGSIRMIAGPDLVASTIEPHEFLDFLEGKLARRFIEDEAGVTRRLSEGDEARRFDGRHGVVELFCHADTWKMTLKRLVQDSDAILMDLRGFTPSNKGCAFEIDALLDLAPLERIVFVIDETTDEAFLRETFATGWAAISLQSPNRLAATAPCAGLFRFGAQGRDERRLVAVVAAAAKVPPRSAERGAKGAGSISQIPAES